MADIDVNNYKPHFQMPDGTQGKDGEKINQKGTTGASIVTRKQTEAAPGNKIFKDTIDDVGGKLKAQITSTPDANQPKIPTPVDSGTLQKVPKDIEGNIWFSGNAFLNLKLSAMEIKKVNREAAQTLGLMEADLTKLYTEMKKEEAHLTKKSYQEQARMAMMEMIGASVSIGVSVANLGFTALSMGIGATKMAKGGGAPAAKAGTDVPDAPPPTTAPAKPTLTNRLEGATSAGHTYSMSAGQSLAGIGQNIGSIISSAAKMEGYTELAQIESAKIRVQAAAELAKQILQTLGEEAKNALQHSQEVREQEKKTFEDLVRAFGSITAH